MCKANPYGPAEFIPKEECIAHVANQMGTGLRALLKECKGEDMFHSHFVKYTSYPVGLPKQRKGKLYWCEFFLFWMSHYITYG